MDANIPQVNSSEFIANNVFEMQSTEKTNYIY